MDDQREHDVQEVTDKIRDAPLQVKINMVQWLNDNYSDDQACMDLVKTLEKLIRLEKMVH